MAPRPGRVCDILLPQCKVNLVAAHTTGAVRVPGTRDLPATRHCTRPRSRGAGARVLLSVFALVAKKGRREGRAPAGTQGPHAKTHAGVTTGDAGTSGLPCAMVLRLMARSPRGAMHYCPRRLADDRCAHSVEPHITASLDAQTPGVRTTRFCRPRTSLPGHPEACACSPPKPKRTDVTAPGRSRRSRWLTGVARPATSSRAGAAASIASRLTYRDDRETPLLAGWDGCGLPEDNNSVNQNIRRPGA
ncbi:hypothetical protein Bra1253DRAFT_02200 [Bradyrhizobium sp. WSM1253]|nr:hypothetical protein Bra1253DRAFT_02200 [Bradyrhizobium sp. WSM1253]